ncbi:MAG TPA: BamA/TamA family outer membrane protein, partial [Eudoraea sp.]|nr:BamA/TamA family outer membrane protein [Eudoraea sp.]
MMNLIKGFLLPLLIISLSSASGQLEPAPETDSKNLKFTALPILYYLPETGLGYGGLGVATFRFERVKKETRPSSLQLALSLTTKRQFLLFAPYELYWKDDKWRLVGELGYYEYIYNFYGIGIDSREGDKETYNVTFPRIRMALLRELLPNFSFGLSYELDGYHNLEKAEEGMLASAAVPGIEGGTVSNVGITAIYDTRDNIFHPTRGVFIQTGVHTSAGFLGSSFDYDKVELDARYYQRIKGRHILAFDFFTAGSSSGTPFMAYYYLGSKRTRGFNDRRFLGLSELTAVIEYRFPVAGRFGATVFSSTG